MGHHAIPSKPIERLARRLAIQWLLASINPIDEGIGRGQDNVELWKQVIGDPKYEVVPNLDEAHKRVTYWVYWRAVWFYKEARCDKRSSGR